MDAREYLLEKFSQEDTYPLSQFLGKEISLNEIFSWMNDFAKVKVEEVAKVPPPPIELTEPEVRWIRLCKGHDWQTYPVQSQDWVQRLIPMFNEIYGWTAEEDYAGFLDCIFRKLLDIHLKIKLDESGRESQLQEIFKAAFGHSISRTQKLPIERAIAELCGLIQGNAVQDKDGKPRYSLQLKKGAVIEIDD